MKIKLLIWLGVVLTLFSFPVSAEEFNDITPTTLSGYYIIDNNSYLVSGDGTAYDISFKHTFNKETEGELKWEERFYSFNEKANFTKYIAIVTGSISGIFLISGIVLKVKEKGGIKIVD